MSKSVILVNYDELQRISKSLQNESEAIAHLQAATHRQVEALHGSGWTGEAANTFFREQEDHLLPAVLRVAWALNESELVLNQVMDLIHAADEETAGYFKGLGGMTLSIQGHTLTDGLLSSLGNLYKADKSFVDIMLSFLGGRMDFQAELKLLGLSDAYGIFKNGIPYLGDFDKFMRGINNSFNLSISVGDVKILKLKGFDLLGMGLGTLDDIVNRTYDDNWGRALGVNIVDGVVKAGLSTAFPPVGAVLLANSGIQLVGNLQVAAEKLQYSFIDDPITRQLLLDGADLKSRALDKMDLGNITKSFSETVVDAFTHPDRFGSDLLNTGNSALSVLDGASEYIVNQNIITPANRVIWGMNQAIQILPVSDEIKRASTIATRETLQLSNYLMQGFTNWIPLEIKHVK